MVEASPYYIVREPDLPMVPVDPDDPDGERMLAEGYKIVHKWRPGAPQSAKYVVHAAPDAPPIGAAETALERAEISTDGRYDAARVRSHFPASVADRVLWATWEDTRPDPLTGRSITLHRRGPVATVPSGARVVLTDQIPHVRAGQGVA